MKKVEKKCFDPKYKHVLKPGFWLYENLAGILPTFLPLHLEHHFLSKNGAQYTLLSIDFLTTTNINLSITFQMLHYFTCYIEVSQVGDGPGQQTHVLFFAQCYQILAIWPPISFLFGIYKNILTTKCFDKFKPQDIK